MTGGHPLLIGEIFVDVTIMPRGVEDKLRLGGVVHAARGMWAKGIPYKVAAILPHYLVPLAKHYLSKFGCEEFIPLAYISNAPNVTLIFDATEVSDQGYETLLREEKSIDYIDNVDPTSLDCADALVFPGTYDLNRICSLLRKTTRLHVDVAYDIESADQLLAIDQPISTIFISTSSPLFLRLESPDLLAIAAQFAKLKPEALVLKENRGGARLYLYDNSAIEPIPAQLGQTVNSVGVGDVFDAAYLAELSRGPVEAAWRAAHVSAAYAQTTEPDIFERYTLRSSDLTLDELQGLGGTFLPWEARRAYSIYLAAPDFQNGERDAIDRAISALSYHNFQLRRPIIENGELPIPSDTATLSATYHDDVQLLENSQMVFAVPTNRDPGTLVEIGIALARNIPVVVYDPRHECANTMVIGGAYCYSDELDTCLNATFSVLSTARLAQHG